MELKVLTNHECLKAYKENGQHYILTNGKIFLIDSDIFQKLKDNNIELDSLPYHFGIKMVCHQLR